MTAPPTPPSTTAAAPAAAVPPTAPGAHAKTAMIVIAAGRAAHLRNQQRAVAAPSTTLPDEYVLVSMGDPAAIAATMAGPLAGRCPLRLIQVPVVDGLPLAAARNAGAAAALADGAQVLIFLDVDCLPGPDLVTAYTAAVTAEPGPALYCGTVQYLADGDTPDPDDPGPLDTRSLSGRPHPARPVPGPGDIVDGTDWRLFWSLSFAVSAPTWARLGGFHEGYRGYGGEDTDLGYLARKAGVPLRFIGNADAYHQFHTAENPPRSHLHDIVRNAGIFRQRWGFHPMTGWLQAFADAGMARYDTDLDEWRVIPAGETVGHRDRRI